MRFEHGAKVRVVNPVIDAPFIRKYIGNTYTIKAIRHNLCGDLGYIFKEDERYVWLTEELMLVEKPKFNHTYYTNGKYAMRCETKEQAEVFNRYIRFHAGRDYRVYGSFNFMNNKDHMCFNVNGVTHSEESCFKKDNYTILNFEDFDWSDFTMKKEFTKKDLKNGDVIKRRNGSVEIVCVDTGTVITPRLYNAMSDIADDLRHYITDGDGNSQFDIVAVRRPQEPCDCCFSAFDRGLGRLVYERKEVEEMTLEEVCKALGKEIKIVKK